MDLSLVIPCFNEAHRIESSLAQVLAHLDGLAKDSPGLSFEVVVVDDGSTDGTADRVSAVAERRSEVRLVTRPKNAGKGAAVRQGVLASVGDIVVFLDADLAVDVSHVDHVLPALRNGVDVAVGCRHIEGAAIEKPQGVLRRTLGKSYLAFARTLLGIPVSDVTCGFKGFRRAVALQLFEGARCRRWGFDAEILHLASRERYEVLEVPVTWRDGEGSRVRLSFDVMRSLSELLAVRWRSTTGAYGKGAPKGTRGPR